MTKTAKEIVMKYLQSVYSDGSNHSKLDEIDAECLIIDLKALLLEKFGKEEESNHEEDGECGM